MKLSIIIPSYNEAPTIMKVVGKILLLNIPHHIELIIINDGSSDDTAKILKNLSPQKNIKIITNNKNLGKGASIRKGLAVASGSIILIQDADLEYDPRDISKLLEQFKKENVNVVYGSRVINKNPTSHWTFNFGGRLLTFITNLLYHANITDEATGYKAFRKDVIKNLKLKSRRFEFCPEVTAKVIKNGFKITEVPISYSPRPISEKKIKWHDGLWAIFYLIKYRFFD